MTKALHTPPTGARGDLTMRITVIAACAAFVACAALSLEAQIESGAESPYLFIFAADLDEVDSDFLAVIDLRPESPDLGKAIATTPIGMTASNLFRHSDQPIDLLLTNVVMPGQSGPDLYTQLGLESPELRALFISGHSERLEAEGNLPRTPFLQKPIRVSDLVDRVRKVLGKGKIK